MKFYDVLGIILFLLAVLSVFKLQAISYLYDIHTSERGIDFVFFKFIRVGHVPFSNIQEIRKTNLIGFGYPFAFIFVNRPLSTPFLIRKKKGWFARDVVVTPFDSKGFLRILESAGVVVHID